MDTNTDEVASHANLVLQVHRSHLERMEQFLTTHFDASDVKILARKRSTACKSCSLIFLHVTTGEQEFVENMINRYSFVPQGVNKYYILSSERAIMKGNFDTMDELEELCRWSTPCASSHYLLKVLQKIQSGHQKEVPVKVKLEVYPIKLQHQIVTNLTELLDRRGIPEEVLDITPKNQTHTLSIIQIYSETYLVGVVEGSTSLIRKVDTTNDISRAYHKLSEAFERYQHQDNPMGVDAPFFSTQNTTSGSKRKSESTRPVIAVDCGAAPGGWTKYLTEQTACDEVYAIDPGKIDESLTSLPSVHHLKMTAAKAIPQLRDILARQDNAIALWVSDMCVHDVPTQVDMFLRAYREGIFQPGAAFVLTIKCNIGHGSKRFNSLAEGEAKRLTEACGAYGIKIVHLFFNRTGERTVVGFIK